MEISLQLMEGTEARRELWVCWKSGRRRGRPMARSISIESCRQSSIDTLTTKLIRTIKVVDGDAKADSSTEDGRSPRESAVPGLRE